MSFESKQLVSAQETVKQSGAVGACWAHNPEVDGSKPSSATDFFSFFFLFLCFCFVTYLVVITIATKFCSMWGTHDLVCLLKQ